MNSSGKQNELEQLIDRLRGLDGAKGDRHTKGSFLERCVEKMLEEVLEERDEFGIGTGTLVPDMQCDLVVYDRTKGGIKFQEGRTVVLVPRVARLVVEVKWNLDRTAFQNRMNRLGNVLSDPDERMRLAFFAYWVEPVDEATLKVWADEYLTVERSARIFFICSGSTSRNAERKTLNVNVLEEFKDFVREVCI